MIVKQTDFPTNQSAMQPNSHRNSAFEYFFFRPPSSEKNPQKRRRRFFGRGRKGILRTFLIVDFFDARTNFGLVYQEHRLGPKNCGSHSGTSPGKRRLERPRTANRRPSFTGLIRRFLKIELTNAGERSLEFVQETAKDGGITR